MIFMPISPKNCLVLYDKDTYIMKDINNNSILLEDRSNIQQMNIMLADNSYNCLIYNNRQNSYIIDLIPFINPNKVLPVYDQGFLSPIYPTGVYELSFFELNENMLDIILPDTREGIKRPSAQKALYSNISAFLINCLNMVMVGFSTSRSKTKNAASCAWAAFHMIFL